MIPHGLLASGNSASNNAPSPLIGVGSATHFLTNNEALSGTVLQYPLAGVARVQIAGTSSAAYRQLSPQMITPSWGIISFDAPNSFEVQNGASYGLSGNFERNIYFGLNMTLIAPGTATIFANVANTWGVNTQTLTNLGTATFLTSGGTATVETRTITMA
jgi:hypothetical protein